MFVFQEEKIKLYAWKRITRVKNDYFVPVTFAYKFCKVCKRLTAHMLVWLHNEEVLMPKQFGGLHCSSRITVRTKCFFCKSRESKRLLIEGKNSVAIKPRFQARGRGRPRPRRTFLHEEGGPPSSNLSHW